MQHATNNIHLHQLWATPVWEIQLGIRETFNGELLTAIQTIKPRSTGIAFSLFDYRDESPVIAEFENLVVEAARDALKKANIARVVRGMRSGSVNAMGHLGWDSPHAHPHTQLAGVYYVQVPQGSGDLWLLDDRGANVFGGEVEGTKHGRTGTKITPQEGKLVLFPGSVQHFVTQNNSQDYRVSIALNFDCGIAGAR